MASLRDRAKYAWNAFTKPDNFRNTPARLNATYGYRPDKHFYRSYNDKTIIMSLYTRIAIDVANVDIRHVQQNQNGSFIEEINSSLNECLKLSPNIDQTAFSFWVDATLSLLDDGVIAIVPVDTTNDPLNDEEFDVESIRVGEIVGWSADTVRLRVYNERTGFQEEVILSKKVVAIVENPLYSILNAPNSTYQRLSAKLNLLDAIDKQTGSGKLDLIIQLPYTVRGETRKQQAKDRHRELEEQLTGSQYGIAYTDATERITQLNRPAENNLLSQVEYLTKQLYAQIGVTEHVFDGTASEEEFLNYHNRTIKPILGVLVESMSRTFLTKASRDKYQKITFMRDPFELTPVNSIAEIADKFTRNAILSPNEIRSIIGYKPSDDPGSDILRNRNLNESKNQGNDEEGDNPLNKDKESQNGT